MHYNRLLALEIQILSVVSLVSKGVHFQFVQVRMRELNLMRGEQKNAM
jgi:hypothetical protein